MLLACVCIARLNKCVKLLICVRSRAKLEKRSENVGTLYYAKLNIKINSYEALMVLAIFEPRFLPSKPRSRK